MLDASSEITILILLARRKPFQRSFFRHLRARSVQRMILLLIDKPCRRAPVVSLPSDRRSAAVGGERDLRLMR